MQGPEAWLCSQMRLCSEPAMMSVRSTTMSGQLLPSVLLLVMGCSVQPCCHRALCCMPTLGQQELLSRQIGDQPLSISVITMIQSAMLGRCTLLHQPDGSAHSPTTSGTSATASTRTTMESCIWSPCAQSHPCKNCLRGMEGVQADCHLQSGQLAFWVMHTSKFLTTGNICRTPLPMQRPGKRSMQRS